MSHGYAINAQVEPSSPIFTHPVYVKWSTKTVGTAAGEKVDLMQDISAIYPNTDTSELLAYLANLLRLLNLMA